MFKIKANFYFRSVINQPRRLNPLQFLFVSFERKAMSAYELSRDL